MLDVRILPAGREEEDRGDATIYDADPVTKKSQSAQVEFAHGQLIAFDYQQVKNGKNVRNCQDDGADAQDGLRDGVGKIVENANKADPEGLGPESTRWHIPKGVNVGELFAPGNNTITSESPSQARGGVHYA